MINWHILPINIRNVVGLSVSRDDLHQQKPVDFENVCTWNVKQLLVIKDGWSKTI